MKTPTDWDPEALSRSFELDANRAEHRLNELATREDRRAIAREYDEQLARFHIRYHLTNNRCLETPEKLIEKLRRLLDHDRPPHTEARDPERFKDYRRE